MKHTRIYKNLKICIAGISCCGKSTLLESLATLLPHFRMIDGSNALCEIGGIHKKELQRLSEAQKDELRMQFLHSLSAMEDNIIVSGHYSFLHNDNRFEIAMKDDARFYDIVLFMDTDIAEIQQRLRQRDNKEISLELLKKWSDFEAQGLEAQCALESSNNTQTLFSAIDSNAKAVADFISFIQANPHKILPHCIFEAFIQEHKNALKSTIILTDCDGTLDSKDGVKEFYKIKEVSTFFIPNAFHNHRFYGFYQFYRLSQKRLEIDENTYQQACKRAADSMNPHTDLICALRDIDASVVAITAGLRALWGKVFMRFGAPFLLVANDRESIISKETKAYFAKRLTELGYKVIAIGDGIVDSGMLFHATHSILIESKKTEQVRALLPHSIKEKLLVCTPQSCIKSLKVLV